MKKIKIIVAITLCMVYLLGTATNTYAASCKKVETLVLDAYCSTPICYNSIPSYFYEYEYTYQCSDSDGNTYEKYEYAKVNKGCCPNP
ncbi:MAG: hypothetical protein WCD89_07800 [Anaerocolumna sp.]